MICYVLGAAPIAQWNKIKIHMEKQDLLICADGGYLLAQKLGLKPHWVVGDFDSLSYKELGDEINPSRILKFDPIKDETDLELALVHGEQLGYREFEIYGAMGGRFDHTIAVMQLLHAKTMQGCKLRVHGEDCEMFCLHDDRMIFHNKQRHRLSVFSLIACSTGVDIKGGEYPLKDASLYSTVPLGVSNYIIDSQCIVRVKNGTLLLILSKEVNQTDD